MIHFCLFDKVIAFVKDECPNLNTLTNALKSTIFCSPFQLPTPFVGLCFGHAMSKVAQYATNDAKVYLDFKKVNLKAIQTSLQKIIIWTKKSGKGKQECKYVCIIVRLLVRLFKNPMKTCFALRIILFQEILEYQNALPICYAW